MNNYPWVRTFRTALAALGGFLPIVPLLVGAVGVSTTAGVGAVVIGIAAAITRVLMIPEVDAWVNGKLGKSQ